MKLPKITESQFLKQVLQYARLTGWRTLHIRPARTAHGWRTAVQGDGMGFVDVVLVRDRVVWIELKSESGKLRAEQVAWVEALENAGQEVYVLKPSDWSLIEEILK